LMIVLGADLHKSSHTIAGVAAATGELLGKKDGVGRCPRVRPGSAVGPGFGRRACLAPARATTVAESSRGADGVLPNEQPMKKRALAGRRRHTGRCSGHWRRRCDGARRAVGPAPRATEYVVMQSMTRPA
jgi:hypothetical protein